MVRLNREKQEKSFDAVKMTREIRDQISCENQNMNAEEFKVYIKRMRSTGGNTPTVEEITDEVESVRSKRYARKSNDQDDTGHKSLD